MDSNEQQVNNGAILRELSDIKSSLATNTERTTNMDKGIAEIKLDIREIKADFINRREFTEVIESLGVKAIRDDVQSLKEFRWRLAGITSIAAAGMTFVGQIILKYIAK